jgi:hypothetical protein
VNDVPPLDDRPPGRRDRRARIPVGRDRVASPPRIERAADETAVVEPDRAAGARRFRPTAVEWLCLAVAVVLTIQYSWLLDDAFVYFRYVDNALYAGRGLTYNAGEYVEGFSSPLWLVILLAVRSTGLDWWLAVRLLGVLASVAFWALLVRVGRELAPAGAPPFALPLVLLAPAYAVACYFTSGVDAPLVQVMSAAFALAVLAPQERWVQLLAGLGPMVRHELVPPCLLLVAWCAWRTRRVPRLLVATALLTTGAWVAFRVWYFAELLPNTFYLKHVSLARRGVAYVLDTVRPCGLQWVLGLAAAGFAGLAWRDRRAAACGAAPPRLRLPERVALFALALPVAAYVVHIGGDSRHYRYLAFPVGLVVAATAGLPEHLLARVAMHHERPGHKWGLVPLARDIGRIELAAENRPRIGMFRRAVEQGAAPGWVRANLAALETIERKAFNRHRFVENLRLALTFPERIDVERQ